MLQITEANIALTLIAACAQTHAEPACSNSAYCSRCPWDNLIIIQADKNLGPKRSQNLTLSGNAQHVSHCNRIFITFAKKFKHVEHTAKLKTTDRFSPHNSERSKTATQRKKRGGGKHERNPDLGISSMLLGAGRESNLSNSMMSAEVKLVPPPVGLGLLI